MLRRGDHVITTRLEHNSVLRPLSHVRDSGVEVELLPFDSRGFVDPDEFRRNSGPNTRLVVVNHGSNVIGTVQPVAEIGRLCRERGVPFAIDASQTAGMIPVDMEAMNLDVVAFTGHKSLLGPTGIGGLCVREGIEIRHTRAGGTGVRSAVRPHLDEYPYRLEYGTPNMVGIAGLHGGRQLDRAAGAGGHQAHEMELRRQLRDGLREIPGVTLYCQDDLEDHIGVLAFNVDGLEAADAGTMLDVDYDIACRTGLHCAPLVHEQLGTARPRRRALRHRALQHRGAHPTAIAAVRDIAAFRK